DVLVAQGPVALAVPGEIKADRRYLLAQGVMPDVDLGPVKQRMDPNVGVGREIGVVLVPQFRRLVPEVPRPVHAAGTEDPLLGPRRLFVSANAREQSPKA